MPSPLMSMSPKTSSMAASRLPSIVARAGDRAVRTIGGDEVDDRCLVLEVAGKLDPTGIGLQFLGVIAGFEEVTPGSVQRGHAGVAAASQVDRGEIKRKTEQVVAQRAGHELVDLVADLPRHAADDVAGGNAIGDRMAGVELHRIEEGFDEPDLVVGERRIEPVDRLGQHRVAEAVDHVGELGDDARVDVGVVAVRHDEEVDVGLHLAGKILEHEVLVLHLGAELGCLEQAFAVPDQRSAMAEPPSRSGWRPADVRSTSSHSLMKARSLVASTISLVCSTSRLCSEWKMW